VLTKKHDVGFKGGEGVGRMVFLGPPSTLHFTCAFFTCANKISHFRVIFLLIRRNIHSLLLPLARFKYYYLCSFSSFLLSFFTICTYWFFCHIFVFLRIWVLVAVKHKKNGSTVLDIAKFRGHSEVVKLLKKKNWEGFTAEVFRLPRLIIHGNHAIFVRNSFGATVALSS